MHPSGWLEVGPRLTRNQHGRALEVWRDGAWRWSMDGKVALRPERTAEKACRRAVTAAREGTMPDQRYRNGSRG